MGKCCQSDSITGRSLFLYTAYPGSILGITYDALNYIRMQFLNAEPGENPEHSWM